MKNIQILTGFYIVDQFNWQVSKTVGLSSDKIRSDLADKSAEEVIADIFTKVQGYVDDVKRGGPSDSVLNALGSRGYILVDDFLWFLRYVRSTLLILQDSVVLSDINNKEKVVDAVSKTMELIDSFL